MWPFSPLRPKPRADDDDDYILLTDSDYRVLTDDDEDLRPPGRVGLAGRPLFVWSTLLGATWLLFIAAGVASTPYRNGEPVLATPAYRAVARTAAALQAEAAECWRWDSDIQDALEARGEPFALANRLRAAALEAEAAARRMGLARVPSAAVVHHESLRLWYADIAAYLRELSAHLVAPNPPQGEGSRLVQRWQDLQATRQQILTAIQALAANYPGG